ncbi:hypothetical protein AWC20_04370 [Mycobacterium parmense]|nr:hypothetical protein AWC20_04370 [Mycobacterium parmense]
MGIGLLVAGCSAVVTGRALPRPRWAPRSVSGQTVRQVLLGDSSLSRILNQELVIDPRFPPRFGGAETLQRDALTSSADCVGVPLMLQQSVYRGGAVKDVAFETWRHVAKSSEVTSVKEGVVSMPSAADANALFERFSQQWQKCDRAVQPLPDNVVRLNATISNVQNAAAVLAATISIVLATPRSDWEAIPAGRAIGVRDNCLIEVEVDFFNPPKRSSRQPDEINSAAVNVARNIMDRVHELS